MSIWGREAQFKDLLEKGVRKNSKSVIQQLVSIATEDEREVAGSNTVQQYRKDRLDLVSEPTFLRSATSTSVGC